MPAAGTARPTAARFPAARNVCDATRPTAAARWATACGPQPASATPRSLSRSARAYGPGRPAATSSSGPSLQVPERGCQLRRGRSPSGADAARASSAAWLRSAGPSRRARPAGPARSASATAAISRSVAVRQQLLDNRGTALDARRPAADRAAARAAARRRTTRPRPAAAASGDRSSANASTARSIRPAESLGGRVQDRSAADRGHRRFAAHDHRLAPHRRPPVPSRNSWAGPACPGSIRSRPNNMTEASNSAVPTWTRTRARFLSGRGGDSSSDSHTVTSRLGTRWPGRGQFLPADESGRGGFRPGSPPPAGRDALPPPRGRGSAVRGRAPATAPGSITSSSPTAAPPAADAAGDHRPVAGDR